MSFVKPSLIKAKEIVGGAIDFVNCAFISEEDHKVVIARSNPENGDTLFAHIGASLGEAAYIKTHIEFSIKNIALFKPNPSIIDGRYLFYLTISPQFQELAKKSRTGSAQPFLSLGHLRSHKIKYHKSIIEQCKIAGILSAYDDLIENNTRRIAILEEMAQRIYKEWFVDFRYPGYENDKMVESELGIIPEGWDVKQLKDYGEIITGKTPSKKVPKYYGTDIPFIKTPDMRGNMFCISTGEYLSELGAKSQRKKTLPPNTLCVSCIGTAGIVSITVIPSQTNQQINAIVTKDNSVREFIYFALLDLSETIKLHGATGATMLNLSKGKFESLKFVTAHNEIILKFHDISAPLFNEIRNLQYISKNLSQTRDLLLPKLISGKIDVKNLDIDIGRENGT